MSTSSTIEGIAAARIDELPEALGGIARLVRSGLGISGFGAQVYDMPPNSESPPHDETATGQEELYVALDGAGAIVVGEERLPLAADRLVAIKPWVTRRMAAGRDGMRVLCIGGTPGRAYEAPGWSAA
jgi:gentisate 1,2-dioxygenase